MFLVFSFHIFKQIKLNVVCTFKICADAFVAEILTLKVGVVLFFCDIFSTIGRKSLNIHDIENKWKEIHKN